MNFFKIFLLLAVVMAVFLGQSEAGFLKKLGKQIEGVGRRTRDATIKALDVAQKAANVMQTVRGAGSQ